MQIQWERWPRFYIHLGPWSSRLAWRDQGIQNGGLTTQHNTEKRCKSFLICPTFDRTFTFKWVKVSISFNFMFFHDPRRSESIRPGLASWSGPTFVPTCLWGATCSYQPIVPLTETLYCLNSAHPPKIHGWVLLVCGNFSVKMRVCSNKQFTEKSGFLSVFFLKFYIWLSQLSS